MQMMTAKIIIVIFVITALAGIAVLSSNEKYDPTPWSLLLGVVVFLAANFLFPPEESDLWQIISFPTIIYLVFFDIFINILNQEHIFEFLVIKIIHATKSRIRIFYYSISVVSALLSGIMMDISVAIIFIPIVYRATKILNIESRPFILGIAFSISIGNLLSPYSAAVNILIATEVKLSFQWFLQNLFLLFVIVESLTLVFIDYLYLERQKPPSEQAKRILLDIMDPSLLIVKKWRFMRHIGYFLILILLLLLNISPYLVTMIGVLFITIVERKDMNKLFSKISWGLPFLLIGIFLLIGSLKMADIITDLERIISNLIGEYFIVAILLVLLISTLFSSFVSRNLTAVIFIPILLNLSQDIFQKSVEYDLLFIALIIGVNLGGNMIPQASSHVLYTLDFVKKNQILHLDYQSYTKITFILSSVYALMGFLYILAYYGLSFL